jgi:hypothetical protein
VNPADAVIETSEFDAFERRLDQHSSGSILELEVAFCVPCIPYAMHLLNACAAL